MDSQDLHASIQSPVVRAPASPAGSAGGFEPEGGQGMHPSASVSLVSSQAGVTNTTSLDSDDAVEVVELDDYEGAPSAPCLPAEPAGGESQLVNAADPRIQIGIDSDDDDDGVQIVDSSPGDKRPLHPLAQSESRVHGSRDRGKRARHHNKQGVALSPSSSPVVVLLDDEDDDSVLLAQVSRDGPQAGRPGIQPPDAMSGYHLDSCSCNMSEPKLRRKLRAAVASVPNASDFILQASPSLPQQQHPKHTPPAPALLAVCSCPVCGTPLTHRDLRHLLGPSATHRVYTCIATYLLSPPSSREELGVATNAYSASAAAAAGTSAAAGSQASAQKHASLELEQQCYSCPNTPAAFIWELYTALVQQPEGQTEKEKEKEEKEEAQEPRGRTRGKGSRGKGRKEQKRPKEQERSRMGSTWASGTGYGGRQGNERDALNNMQKAAERQQQQDTLVEQQLEGLTTALKEAGRRRGSATRQRRQQQQPLPPQPAVVALVLCSALPYLLRMLLHNDSLQDISARQGLYRKLMDLLRYLGSSIEFVEVFTIKADEDPVAAAAQRKQQQQQQQQQGASAPGPSDKNRNSSSSNSSLLAVLKRLDTQCQVYKRSGQELGQDEDAEVTRALSMALELSSLAEDVTEAVELWKLTIGKSDDAGSLLAAEVGDVQEQEGRQHSHHHHRLGGHATGAGRSGVGTSVSTGQYILGMGEDAARNGNGGLSTSSNVTQGQDAYMEVMQPLVFQEAKLLSGHYFRSAINSKCAMAGGEMMRRRLKRITEEISTLSTSLPLSWESSVFVAVDEDRMDVLRALIIPSSDTPYSHGFFVFDIFLPEEYPNVPPMVQLLTTGGGSVRFNPNLYNCGKVCLSLLGTWSGPSWQPATSTLLQVLVSISAMILVPDPWFNEPGRERSMGSVAGQENSRAYNEQLRADTMRVALLPAVQLAAGCPEAARLPGWDTFKEVIMHDLRAKRDFVHSQVHAWAAEARSMLRDQMMRTAHQITEALRIL